MPSRMVRWCSGCGAVSVLALGWAGEAVTLGSRAGASRTDGPALSVTHRARALQPGEVVLLVVSAPRTLDAVAGTAFDRPVSFYPAGSPTEWHALVGIDLETKPDRHDLTIEGRAGGLVTRRSYTLRVQPKDFPTRRLTVSREYVDPPPDVLDRIESESKRVAEIFDRVTPRRLWTGPFVAPVPGRPTSSFGRRSIFNGQERTPHSGTDFRAAAGAPVMAPNAGLVALSGNLYFAGNSVVLDHGLGLYSFFAHLSKIMVAEGQNVAAGDTIGAVGATGRVTGPHLHWSVRLGNARVDPLSLMRIAGRAQETR